MLSNVELLENLRNTEVQHHESELNDLPCRHMCNFKPIQASIFVKPISEFLWHVFHLQYLKIPLVLQSLGKHPQLAAGLDLQVTQLWECFFSHSPYL